jgi:hypothetical protein
MLGLSNEYDWHDFHSDFLCPFCGQLLYSDIGNPPKSLCINKTCTSCSPEGASVVDISEERESQLNAQVQEEENVIAEEIHKWKPGILAKYAYEARRELITSYFKNGVLPLVNEFIPLGELLLLTNKYKSTGTFDDLQRFNTVLIRVCRWSRDQRNLEELKAGRIILYGPTADIKPLYIKYARSITENLTAFGIVNSANLADKGKLFPYQELEAAVTQELDFAEISDYKQILERFWLMSLGLRHALQWHHRTKIQYDYRPDILDFTVLFGWLIKTWGIGSATIPAEKQDKEIRELQDHFDKIAKSKYSAVDFFHKYADNITLVPIIARTPQGIMMDRDTLFFFLVYLEGCPDPEVTAFKKRGQIIQEMRQKVADKFEVWLRTELRRRGYTGPETAISEKYEYDILAISEEKKRIIIADAKYRDMPLSSFTRDNLVRQELLEPHTLREEADRQQLRLDYFQGDIARFERYLHPRKPWSQYSIDGFLVTKQIPLADGYKKIRIMEAPSFLAEV